MAVVEPVIVTNKVAPASNFNSARTVTYQIEVSHDAALSSADAHELRVEDILSSHNMSYVV